jgi:hypothetical protein
VNFLLASTVCIANFKNPSCNPLRSDFNPEKTYRKPSMTMKIFRKSHMHFWDFFLNIMSKLTQGRKGNFKECSAFFQNKKVYSYKQAKITYLGEISQQATTVVKKDTD